MQNTAHAAYSTRSLDTYKRQNIMLSSPEKCVIHVYDAAISGCARQEEAKTRSAIALLIDALDFDAGPDIATGLFRLYEYCLRLVSDKEFDSARNILKELRDTWEAAMAKQEPVGVTVNG